MKLIIEDDEGKRTVVPFVRDELTIGRHEDNTVRLTEKNVSRKHGRLVREDGAFFIEDLKSFTGIRVNGEKIAGKHPVREGDLIQISEYDLSLQAGPEEKKAVEEGLGEDDEPTHVPQAQAAPEQHELEPQHEPESQPELQHEPQHEPEPQPEPEPQHEAAAAEREAEAAAEADARKKADTAIIRLSDLKAPEVHEEPVRQLPKEKRPRLVGVGGAWRGRELELDRTPIRLGRSDENDVEIDHPSISRKHCRLHLEGVTWKVMDAESRNGVRVNGEPYATIGLRHGDTIEIGHLNFMFVAPGHTVSLPPENVRVAALAAAQGGGAGNSKTLVAALAGALVVALIAVAFFATRHPKGSSSSSEESAEVGPDAKAERKFALRTAEEAVAGHRYGEAIRNLDAARRAGATAAELRNYAAIQAEARSEDLFHEMESALGSQDVDRARKLLGVLTASPQTWYGNKAAEKAEAVIAGYVNLHLAAAGLMKGKDNAGCLAEAQLALGANPRSADAQSLVEGCKAVPQAQASERPAAVHASSRAVEKPSAAAVVATARQGDPDSDAKRLVNDGNQKLVAQDFPAAIALYEQALSLKPGDLVLAGIYRSMGIAFTRQGNIEEGAHYYKLYLPLCTNPGERAQLQKVLDDYEARRR